MITSQYRIEEQLTRDQWRVGDWTLVWTREEFGKWRIRRAPKGAIPPWRNGPASGAATATEDGQPDESWEARWWVWPPFWEDPIASCGSHGIALSAIDAADPGVVSAGARAALESPESSETPPAGGAEPDTADLDDYSGRGAEA